MPTINPKALDHVNKEITNVLCKGLKADKTVDLFMAIVTDDTIGFNATEDDFSKSDNMLMYKAKADGPNFFRTANFGLSTEKMASFGDAKIALKKLGPKFEYSPYMLFHYLKIYSTYINGKELFDGFDPEERDDDETDDDEPGDPLYDNFAGFTVAEVIAFLEKSELNDNTEVKDWIRENSKFAKDPAEVVGMSESGNFGVAIKALVAILRKNKFDPAKIIKESDEGDEPQFKPEEYNKNFNGFTAAEVIAFLKKSKLDQLPAVKTWIAAYSKFAKDPAEVVGKGESEEFDAAFKALVTILAKNSLDPADIKKVAPGEGDEPQFKPEEYNKNFNGFTAAEVIAFLEKSELNDNTEVKDWIRDYSKFAKDQAAVVGKGESEEFDAAFKALVTILAKNSLDPADIKKVATEAKNGGGRKTRSRKNRSRSRRR